MFEKDAEEYASGKGHEHYNFLFEENAGSPSDFARWCFQDGAEFGYNSAIEWFDARERIPVPKQAEIHRYTNEAISDKGDIVCYDYMDKCWKKIVVEDEKVTYVPVEIKLWCNKPTKEIR